MAIRYYVICNACGSVLAPEVGSDLWLKAQSAELRSSDIVRISGIECGCEEEPYEPNAPFRVLWYDEMCVNSDEPHSTFFSAARRYLQLERDGMNVVVFVDNRPDVSEECKKALQDKLRQAAWR